MSVSVSRVEEDVKHAKEAYPATIPISFDDSDDPDTIIYAIQIREARDEKKDLKLALEVFEEAIKTKKANAFTYATMIDALGQLNKGDALGAYKLYKQAVQAGSISRMTYTVMIAAAAKARDIKLAERIFEDARHANELEDVKKFLQDKAKKLKVEADELELQSKKLNKVEAKKLKGKAEKLREKAESQKLFDDVTIGCMINAYYINEDYKNAEDLYKTHSIKLKLTNDKKLDFHTFNEGTAYYVIRDLLERKENIPQIIIGQGIHSKPTGDDEFPIKKGLTRALKECGATYRTPNPENPGVIVIVRSSPAVIKGSVPQAQSQSPFPPSGLTPEQEAGKAVKTGNLTWAQRVIGAGAGTSVKATEHKSKLVSKLKN